MLYVHPLMAGLVIIVAGLTGAAISFIWTNTGISRIGKIEHTILAFIYAVSLPVFLAGMLDAKAALWALPVAIMLMGSGTAWANWRVGTKFWLLFGLMALLGGTSLLITQYYMSEPSLKVFLAFNAPWMILMLWLVGIVLHKAWTQAALRRRKL